MVYLKITITDTMSFWDDYLSSYVFNPENSKTFAGWYRVPDGWLNEGDLTPERRENVLEYMYGASWRSGNGDGSKYEVLKMEVSKLTDADAAKQPWIATKESCFTVGSDGAVISMDRDKM